MKVAPAPPEGGGGAAAVRPLRVHVATWNLGEAAPPEDVTDLLREEGGKAQGDVRACASGCAPAAFRAAVEALAHADAHARGRAHPTAPAPTHAHAHAHATLSLARARPPSRALRASSRVRTCTP